ncbi:MAG: hydroxymethylbilane synthase [Candidatus Methanoplasma sp.]|jgi:hydroxymethylbilane synthase|nr:hydroxymethylbilane synthase [Candidatus Methanoplasma sp.]
MIIGTRDSRLALAQTDIFIRTAAPHSGPAMTVRTIKTAGDADQTSDLKDIGGYGAFVRELDTALIVGEIDVSVNSMKDVPVFRGSEITIGAVLPRASCEDVVLPMRIGELPYGAVVGSSSVRRTVILRSIRPDLEIRGLRGNIDTRLGKLDRGDYDAIILAKAGLERLGIEREVHSLDIDEFVPAPGQGAIAAACRSSDDEAMDILKKVDDAGARAETEAERTLMKIMGGICSSPIGINAKREGDRLTVRAVFFDGAVMRRCKTAIPLRYEVSDLEKIAAKLKGE